MVTALLGARRGIAPRDAACNLGDFTMATPPIRVAVHGATGRMGRVLVNAIANADDVTLVASISQASLVAHDVDAQPKPHDSVETLLDYSAPDVVVDFSIRETVLPIARSAAACHAHFVTGTSGLTEDDIDELRTIAAESDIGVMVGPNFSLGAVVLERVAQEAGRYFDSAEIIEMHHAGKADAPSGSALATARGMVEARGGDTFTNPAPAKVNLEQTRGGNLGGIAIHSVRMQGLMAHQQVLLGGPGETLTLRHDLIDRESYMPGVLLAVREIAARRGHVTVGLGALLWPDRKEE